LVSVSGFAIEDMETENLDVLPIPIEEVQTGMSLLLTCGALPGGKQAIQIHTGEWGHVDLGIRAGQRRRSVADPGSVGDNGAPHRPQTLDAPPNPRAPNLS
jgi:hypothetical protein